MAIDYSQKIPNNVQLADDRTLQRALEQWQPNFIQWWDDVGPDESAKLDVYLRTATSVDPQGWAHFDYVKMRDYRWGIFLNPAEADRKIHFGDHLGEAAWQNWIFQRPNAVGEKGALKVYGTGEKAGFDFKRV